MREVLADSPALRQRVAHRRVNMRGSGLINEASANQAHYRQGRLPDIRLSRRRVHRQPPRRRFGVREAARLDKVKTLLALGGGANLLYRSRAKVLRQRGLRMGFDDRPGPHFQERVRLNNLEVVHPN